MESDQIAVIEIAIVLIAVLAWYFFGPKRTATATMTGDVQEIRITVKCGYSPNQIQVRQGVPVPPGHAREIVGEA